MRKKRAHFYAAGIAMGHSGERATENADEETRSFYRAIIRSFSAEYPHLQRTAERLARENIKDFRP